MDGSIPPTMTPEAVRQVEPHRVEHEKWPLKNWKSNLANLRSAISRDRMRMARDARDYGHDKKIVMNKRNEAGVPTPWHKTDCPKLLKQDIDAGKHLTMHPRDMYNDPERPQYRKFELSVFRNHVYQEIDCRPKREMRFERKKKGWKYPELHEDHPRLKGIS